MKKKDGGPAFPRPYSRYVDGIIEFSAHEQAGMTLRDYFAAAALTGILARKDAAAMDGVEVLAYIYADEMLFAREA